MRELATGLPKRPTLIYSAKFSDAHEAEQRLHNALKEKRVEQGGSEYFFLSPEDAKQLVQAWGFKLSDHERHRQIGDSRRAYRQAVAELDRGLEHEIGELRNRLTDGLYTKIRVTAKYLYATICIVLFFRYFGIDELYLVLFLWLPAGLLWGLFVSILKFCMNSLTDMRFRDAMEAQRRANERSRARDISILKEKYPLAIEPEPHISPEFQV